MPHTKTNTKVQFPDLRALFDYLDAIDLRAYEVLREEFILLVELTEFEIERAILEFEAEVVRIEKD
jgi:hypothetical protein